VLFPAELKRTKWNVFQLHDSHTKLREKLSVEYMPFKGEQKYTSVHKSMTGIPELCRILREVPNEKQIHSVL
jgi:hypothetical protein